MAPDFADLSAYLDGELSAAERRTVEAHLAADPEYARERVRLERTRTMITLCIEQPGFRARLTQRIREEEDRALARTWNTRRMVLALAAVLALAFGFLIYAPWDRGPSSPPAGSQTPASAPVQLPGPQSAPAVVAVAQQPTSTTEPETPAAVEPPLEATQLPFKLLGTVTGPMPSAIISVEKNGAVKSGSYGIGEAVTEGIALASVEQGKAVLDDHGREIVLTQATVAPPANDLSGEWLAETFINRDAIGQRFEVTMIQTGNTLRVTDNSQIVAVGTLIGNRLRATIMPKGEDPIEIEGQLNNDRTVLTGALPREALGVPEDTPGEPVFRLTKIRAAVPNDVLQQRRLEVQKMAQILMAYAAANKNAFPAKLEDLVPDYAPDLEAFASTAARTVEYHAYNIPADQRWPKYEDIDPSLPIPDRLILWEQRLKEAGLGALVFRAPLLAVAYKDPVTVFHVDISGKIMVVPTAASPSDSPADLARFDADRVRCQNNLKQLGLVLKMFENEHEGYTPAGWLSTYPEYITDPSILTSPKDPPGTDSYLYLYPAANLPEMIEQGVAQLDPEGNNPAAAAMYESQLPIVTNKTDYPGLTPGRNVLFADGHVEYVSTSAWRERVQPFIR